jgi:subtilisin family serine protease
MIGSISGRAPPGDREVLPGIHVFDNRALDPSTRMEVANRLRNEGIASVAIPVYLGAGRSDIILSDRFMVKFSPDAAPEVVRALTDAPDISVIRRPSPDSGRSYYTFTYPSGTVDPLAFANEVAVTPGVEWASPDMQAGQLFGFPTDPLFPLQFNLENPLIYQGRHVDIEPEWAWFETRGAGVTVAIVDGGIQVGHPDFSFTQPIKVYDAFGDTAAAVNPQGPNSGHGTAVAGFIFAEHNNGRGIAGIAPDAHIAVARTYTDLGGGAFVDYVAAAIAWTWSIAGADIVSMSWGYNEPQHPILEVILAGQVLGRNGKGTLFVAAAGNNPPATVYNFPASIGGVVGVSAIGPTGALAEYALPGLGAKDLVAPSKRATGEPGLPTTDVTGFMNGYSWAADSSGHYYLAFGGTSASTPQVAGAAALILSRFPNLNQGQLHYLLRSTADNWGATTYFGSGKLNASRAAGVSELAAQISGPDVILSKGSHTWTASPWGGIGSYSYRWRRRYVGGSWSTVGTGVSVNLTVYGGDDDFDLELRAISGGQTKYETLRVVNCIGGGGPECVPIP